RTRHSGVGGEGIVIRMIERGFSMRAGLAVLACVATLAAGPAAAEDGWTAKTSAPSPARLMELFMAANGDSSALAAAQQGANAADDGVANAYMGLLAPRANAIFDKSREKQQVYRTDTPLFSVGKTYFGNYSRTFEVVEPIFDARLL